MISTLSIKKYILILIIILTATYPHTINAENNIKNLVNIYFFHSRDCSHCNNEIKFLDSLEEKYSNIKIYRYEIHENQNNEKRLNVQKIYKIKNNGVPLTIIGDTPYIGYREEKSNLIFIKTIEYYSKYGYKDQVGELLQIKTLPTYKIEETNLKLDEFIDKYGNYKLIGSLYTDDLDLSSNALVLGVLSQFNLIKIIATIIVLTLISKIKEKNKKIFQFTSFLIMSLFLNTTYVISNNIYTIIIGIIIIFLFTLELSKYLKTKKRHYLYNNILIIIVVISSYLENYFYLTYSKIFKEIIRLNIISGLNKMNCYGNYFFMIITINLLFIAIYYSTKIKISNKKTEKERFLIV